MHGEADSAPCLGYNFRIKLKVCTSSPSSLCQEIREVRKPSRYTDSWQTAEIRAKMSVWLVQAGLWFHVLLPVCHSYSRTTKSVKGRLVSKHQPEVLVPTSFLVSPSGPIGLGWLSEQGQGRASRLEGYRVVRQRKFLKGLQTPLLSSSAHQDDSQSHLPHWDKTRHLSRKIKLALFCNN